MAAAFNLTAQLNLVGPNNVKKIASDIRRELGTVNGQINIKIDPKTLATSAKLNSQFRKLNTTLAQTSTIAKTASRNLAALSRSVNDIKANTVARDTMAMADSVSKLGDTSRSSAKDLQIMGSELAEFGRQSGLAIRRFAAFSVVSSVIYKLNNAVSAAIDNFISFDKELVRVAQVTGKDVQQLSGLVSEITNLSTTLGVTSDDLIQVSSTLAQAGLSAAETESALRALALSANAPSFDSLNDTVEGSIALMRQFGIKAEDLEEALGAVNAVSAAFAVEASDIITAIQRTGGVFASASRGVSSGTDALNEFIAIFTSVRATTRESAETIATGLRTIFARIQRKDTIEALRGFGVELTDLEGKFVGPFEAVRRLSEGLSKLDPRDLQFAKIVEELGGFRQIGKVIPLIQQYATTQQALKVAQQGSGSLALDSAKAQLALANRLVKVREEFVALIRDLGNSTVIKGFVNVTLSLTTALLQLARAGKGLFPLLTIIGGMKAISGITQFAGGFLQGVRPSGAKGESAARNVGTNLGETISGAKSERETAALDRVASSIESNAGDLSALAQQFATIIPAINNMASSIQQSIVELNANTSALSTNTASLDNLANIISSGGTTSGFNAGGTVRKFARGGLVPGVGNGDTVPAMLEPGEFVIRKKAVETLGASKLHEINKYAWGGKVKDLANIYPSIANTSNYTSYANKSINDRSKFVPVIPTTDERIEFQEKSGKNYEKFEDLVSKKYKTGAPSKGFKYLDYPDTRSEAKFMQIGSGYGDSDGKGNNPETIAAKNFLYENSISAIPGNVNNTSVKTLSTTDISNKPATVYYPADTRDFFRPIRTATLAKERFPFGLYSLGGLIQQFEEGGVITKEDAAKASRKQILDVLSSRPGGIDTTAKKVGISAAEIYNILGKRNPDAKVQALQDAIRNEYMITSNRRAGAAKGQLTRLSNQNLVVAAAGMFGKKFADTTEEIESPLLSSSPKVRIISGIMDANIASALGATLSQATQDITNRATESIMIADILNQFGLGKELNLDFDRTLADGADKILSDPGTPVFSEFGNRDKVSEALGGARLTTLGQSLVDIVQQRKDLLSYIRIVTARPESTLDLIQQWLAQNDLPIPLSQFKGFGKPGLGAKDIAQLKAAFLNPGSLFVDDDPRNIEAANARKDVSTYQYRTGTSLPNPQAEGDLQGLLLEQIVQKLGGPGALKGFGFDFPNGLGGAAKYFGLPDDIPTDVKRTISGPSTIKDNIITYLKNVMGYNRGGFAAGGTTEDTVPALLTPGEFVINKKAAQKIGYGKLSQMNQADKIQGFNAGGLVGNIQRFEDGGTPKSVGASSVFGFDFGDKIFNKLVPASEQLKNKLMGLNNVIVLGAWGKVHTAIGEVTKTVDNINHDLTILDKWVPGLAEAMKNNAIANKRSLNAQDSLVAAIYDKIGSTKDEKEAAAVGGDILKQLNENTASLTKTPIITSGGSGQQQASPIATGEETQRPKTRGVSQQEVKRYQISGADPKALAILKRAAEDAGVTVDKFTKQLLESVNKITQEARAEGKSRSEAKKLGQLSAARSALDIDPADMKFFNEESLGNLGKSVISTSSAVQKKAVEVRQENIGTKNTAAPSLPNLGDTITNIEDIVSRFNRLGDFKPSDDAVPTDLLFALKEYKKDFDDVNNALKSSIEEGKKAREAEKAAIQEEKKAKAAAIKSILDSGLLDTTNLSKQEAFAKAKQTFEESPESAGSEDAKKYAEARAAREEATKARQAAAANIKANTDVKYNKYGNANSGSEAIAAAVGGSDYGIAKKARQDSIIRKTRLATGGKLIGESDEDYKTRAQTNLDFYKQQAATQGSPGIPDKVVSQKEQKELGDKATGKEVVIGAIDAIENFGNMIQLKSNGINAALSDTEGNASKLGSIVQSFGNTIANGAKNTASFIRNANQKFLGTGLGQVFKQLSGMKGLLAAVGGSAGLRSAADTMGGYKTTSGTALNVASSTFDMASQFGAAGSVLGPFGTAVGAATGALIGLAKGVAEAKDALRDIRKKDAQAQVQTASEKAANDLQAFSGAMDPEQASKDEYAFMGNLSETIRAERKVKKESTGAVKKGIISNTKLEGAELAQWAQGRAAEEGAAGNLSKEYLSTVMEKTGKSFEELDSVIDPDTMASLTQQIAEADSIYQQSVEEIRRGNHSNEEFRKKVEEAKQAAVNRAMSDAKVAKANENFAKQAENRKRLESGGENLMKEVIGATPKERRQMMEEISAAGSLSEGNTAQYEALQRKAYEKAYRETGGSEKQKQEAGEQAAAGVRQSVVGRQEQLLSFMDPEALSTRQMKADMFERQLQTFGVDTSQGKFKEILDSMRQESPEKKARQDAINATKENTAALKHNTAGLNDTGDPEPQNGGYAGMSTTLQDYAGLAVNPYFVGGAAVAGGGAYAARNRIRRSMGVEMPIDHGDFDVATGRTTPTQKKSWFGGWFGDGSGSGTTASAGAAKPKKSWFGGGGWFGSKSASKAAESAASLPVPKVKGKVTATTLGLGALTAGAAFFGMGGSAQASQDASGAESIEIPENAETINILAQIEENTRNNSGGNGIGNISTNTVRADELEAQLQGAGVNTSEGKFKEILDSMRKPYQEDSNFAASVANDIVGLAPVAIDAVRGGNKPVSASAPEIGTPGRVMGGLSAGFGTFGAGISAANLLAGNESVASGGLGVAAGLGNAAGGAASALGKAGGAANLGILGDSASLTRNAYRLFSGESTEQGTFYQDTVSAGADTLQVGAQGSQIGLGGKVASVANKVPGASKLSSLGSMFTKIPGVSKLGSLLPSLSLAGAPALMKAGGSLLGKAMGPLELAIGGYRGYNDDSKEAQRRSKTENTILGALTGSAHTGDSITGGLARASGFNVQQGGGLDAALGGWEAMARGAAVGGMVGGGLPGAVVGAAVGGGAEVYKSVRALEAEQSDAKNNYELTQAKLGRTVDSSKLNVTERSMAKAEAMAAVELEKAKRSGDANAISVSEMKLKQAQEAKFMNRSQDSNWWGGGGKKEDSADYTAYLDQIKQQEMESQGLSTLSDRPISGSVKSPLAGGEAISGAIAQYEQMKAEQERQKAMAAQQAAMAANGVSANANPSPVSQATSSIPGVSNTRTGGQIGPANIGNINMGSIGQTLNGVFDNFINGLQNVTLPKIPETVKMEGMHTVEVIINGADALSSLTQTFQDMMKTKIDEALKKINNNTEGGFGPQP